jgi:hypothetical protein
MPYATHDGFLQNCPFYALKALTFCNLANIDTTLHGGLLGLIEVRLMCVGVGPTLDLADAFLAAFQPMIDAARRRRL